MRVRIGRIAALAFVVGILAGCDGSGSRGDASDDRTAEGEVRGGTISDDMLPFDTVQSQSPPLKAGGTRVGLSSDDAAEAEGEEGAGVDAGTAGAAPAEAAATTPAAQ